MYKCTQCDKSFFSELALRGHGRAHSDKTYNTILFDYSVCCIETKTKIQTRYFEQHLNSLCKCGYCSKTFKKGKGSSGQYCSRSCSVSATNKARGPKTAEEKTKISTSLRIFHSSNLVSADVYGPFLSNYITKRNKKPISKINTYPHTRIELHLCEHCTLSFWRKQTAYKPSRFCSKKCINEAQSERMIKKIQLSGTTNFSTRVNQYTYKHVTIDCDSKLEAAGVNYLIDYAGASHIERCTSIINFKDRDGVNHKFLPDFFVIINDEKYIVEVKQVYKKSTQINNYNRFFIEKRVALENFCMIKNLKSMWLDFDYDPRFGKLYKKFLQASSKKE